MCFKPRRSFKLNYSLGSGRIKTLENCFWSILAFSKPLNIVDVLSLLFSSKGDMPVFVFNLLRMCDQNALGLLFDLRAISFSCCYFIPRFSVWQTCSVRVPACEVIQWRCSYSFCVYSFLKWRDDVAILFVYIVSWYSFLKWRDDVAILFVYIVSWYSFLKWRDDVAILFVYIVS